MEGYISRPTLILNKARNQNDSVNLEQPNINEQSEQYVKLLNSAINKSVRLSNNLDFDILASERINQSKPKRGRKRKYPSQNRQIRKMKCLTNQTYTTQRGKIKEAKIFREFSCSCGCYSKIGREILQKEFEKFYNVDSHDAQRALICAMVSEKAVKRRRAKNSQKRTSTRTYRVADIQVCKPFFLKSFGISSGKVHMALKKMRISRKEDSTFTPKPDIMEQYVVAVYTETNPLTESNNSNINIPLVLEHTEIVHVSEKTEKQITSKKEIKRMHPSPNQFTRNDKHLTNETYFTQRGKIKESKTLKEYLCPCGCFDKIGRDVVQREFEQYYKSGSHNAQSALICAMVSEEAIKRRMKNSQNRTSTRIYRVAGIQVCKPFFLKTFGISSGKVHMDLKK